MPVINDTRPNITYLSDCFDISVFVKPQETYILTKFFTDNFSTLDYPETHAILKNEIPQVLDNICHNDLDLPFYEEVKNTELAHLFEHILIQEIANMRDIQKNYKDYSGETAWDWTEDDPGVFHVTLSATTNDLDIIETACNRSVQILNRILESEEKAKQTRKTRLPARFAFR